MQCELCGADIRGIPKIVQIEGAELRVCIQCAKYGTEIQQKRGGEARGRPTAGASPAPRRHVRDVFDYMEGDIVEDYADRIRKARMSRGWDQKTLALEIKEREILIKKIEKGDLIPEDEVRKKLEKALGIRLIECGGEEGGGKGGGRVSTTLGDLISIRREKA
ncbi:MAG: multiprotein bridging factor aMBF1 [Methanomicrobiales archaeon]|nr:multiprotein bridging factor aMBF1 [Methanomicrobiales archaeon]MDI6877561.1 multiprotein bridging factor aMBF1 [Methanomicrobiales archaeon]